MHLTSLIIFGISALAVVRGYAWDYAATVTSVTKAASMLQKAQRVTKTTNKMLKPPSFANTSLKHKNLNCFATYIQSKRCKKSFPELESVFGSSLELLPSVDVLVNKYSTCAVVSSSPRMLLYEHGPDIDQHDMVIRFNDAEVEGFEKYVGSKTDILLFNNQLHLRGAGYDLSWLPLDAAPTKVMRSWHTSLPYHPEFDEIEGYIVNRRMYPDEKLYMLNAHFNEFLKGLLDLQRGTPSTGFMGVILALQMCDVVDVYELVPSIAPAHGIHYYDRVNTERISENTSSFRILSAKSDACVCISTDIVGNQALQQKIKNASHEDQPKEYCPHDCNAEHAFLSKYNVLPADVTNQYGMIRLSASKHPELRFCR